MLLIDVWTNFFAKPSFPADASRLPSIYDFNITDPANPHLDLQKYRGKKLLIVNTASACSFTKQYRDFQRVYENHRDQLNVLAFPCNDFGKQEVLEDGEIPDFCTANFRVTYPVFNKVMIKGKTPSPLFYWLRMSSLNGWNDRRPSWNFWKYVLNEKGQLTAVIPSKYRILENNLSQWTI